MRANFISRSLFKMKKIRINFTNGLTYRDSKNEILGELTSEYYFEEDKETPQIVIFGPYGNDIPEGDFIRVGYFCENFMPDMTTCEYGFGIPYEEEINHPRYRRIDFHGFDSSALIKKSDFANLAIEKKKYFCNFLYGNCVPYRESFFTELNKYKLVHAPGKSMQNRPSLPNDSKLGMWNSKREYISEYKFTISFENYTYPGYHTEKILDPMLAGSIPIYIGNPEIEKHFNHESFIHGRKYIKNNRNSKLRLFEKIVQPDYCDWRPSVFNSVLDKIKRKSKIIGRNIKIKYEFHDGFKELIDEIIRLDRDDNAYFEMLKQPWYPNNEIPDRSRFLNQWREIFNSIDKI
jgi:alpha(1,3/1,4) fucosyltransferase